MKAIIETIKNGQSNRQELLAGKGQILNANPPIIVEVFSASALSQTDGVSVTVGKELPFCYPLLGRDTHFELVLPDATYRVDVVE